jgi:tripartite-type tricarboxylate transporter receptor subunit TctC
MAMQTQRLLLSLLFAACVGTIGSVNAQIYPSRPVTFVVPFPAGAPLDTIARIVGERMRRTLGQPVIIENVTGAAGTIGVGRVARAAADGYTVSIGNFSSHIVAAAIYSLHYDVLRDFEPVALLASNPQLIVSRERLADQ